MLAAGADPEGGIHVKTSVKAVDVTASQETVDGALAAFERIYSQTLTWSADNPLQFCAILAFAAFCVVQSRKGKTDRARFELEYGAHRKDAKKLYQQEQLPLPEPVPKLTTGGRNGGK